MNKKLTFLLALTFLFLFSGFSVVFGDDYNEAFKGWELAAEQRHERAQFNLALMHDDSLDCLNSPN